MPGPIDLSALGLLLAVAILVAGTTAVCVGLAVAARVVDRVWDRLAPDEEERERRPSARTSSVGVGTRRRGRVSRPVLATILTGALLAALGWLSFTLGRVRDLV